MITGILSNGFKYEADERILSDFRLVDAIAMIESEDNAEKLKGMTDFCKLILGENNQKKLFRKLKKENGGFVPQDEVYSAAKEIMTAMKGETAEKKSDSSQE